MRTLILAAAIATLSAPAFAQAPTGSYGVDKTHASITWKGLHQGLSWYPARFTNFDINLDFNEADVSKSKVTATVDMKSVETDFARTRPASSNTDFNAELAGERFLNAVKFPQATFTSTSITKTGDKTGKMTGNLTFLGITKPVTFDVTYIGNRNDPRSQKHKVGFQAVGSLIKLEINAELIQK
jgi:polyisoprenoid-binding protein YceI